jgi:hypothetical protein
LFSLNVLGKVSIFKNLYDYSKKSTPNNKELSPEQIQRISQLMERRCDQSNLPKLNSPINDSDKQIVIQIIESVYSSDNILRELTNFQDQLISVHNNENNENNEKKNTQMIENITKNPQIIEGIKYYIT